MSNELLQEVGPRERLRSYGQCPIVHTIRQNLGSPEQLKGSGPLGPLAVVTTYVAEIMHCYAPMVL